MIRPSEEMLMADDSKVTWIVIEETLDEEDESVYFATGPFSSQDEAGNWMDSLPKNKEVVDASVWFLNTPTPIEGD